MGDILTRRRGGRERTPALLGTGSAGAALCMGVDEQKKGGGHVLERSEGGEIGGLSRELAKGE